MKYDICNVDDALIRTKIVTIQRNKSAFDSGGRSLSGAEAMLLAWLRSASGLRFWLNSYQKF